MNRSHELNHLLFEKNALEIIMITLNKNWITVEIKWLHYRISFLRSTQSNSSSRYWYMRSQLTKWKCGPDNRFREHRSFILCENIDVTEVSQGGLTGMAEHVTAQTQLAHQPGAAKPEMAGCHHKTMSVIFRSGWRDFAFMWLEFIIMIMKYLLPLNLQLQDQYPNPHFPNCRGWVYSIIFLWIYSIRI